MDWFELPVVCDQLMRQVVEQFWVARFSAIDAEIVGRTYKTQAEILNPQAIDDDPSRQRIICGNDPPRKRSLWSRRILRQFVHARVIEHAVVDELQCTPDSGSRAVPGRAEGRGFRAAT